MKLGIITLLLLSACANQANRMTDQQLLRWREDQRKAWQKSWQPHAGPTYRDEDGIK
jgi:hypothetical protein